MDDPQVNDPGQFLLVLRDVLLEHMDTPGTLDEYRICRAMYFDHAGIMADDDIASGRSPRGLRLTMRDGSELALIVDHTP